VKRRKFTCGAHFEVKNSRKMACSWILWVGLRSI